MLKVALTGNRFSGKNRVSKLFNSISIPVFDADTCIKYLICHNFEFTTKVKQKMVNFFDGDNKIDPGRVNTSALDHCIDIIEPEIFRLYEKYCERNSHSVYVIFKSSILFERGWNKKFDYTINVFAPVHYRIERCHKKDGTDYEDIYEFANGEILDEKKNMSSDFVVHSYDGGPDIIKSVNEIDTKIIDQYLKKY